MKPKLNKNLSLPWDPQGEKASGNHQIILPKENALDMYQLNFPHMLLTMAFFSFKIENRISDMLFFYSNIQSYN